MKETLTVLTDDIDGRTRANVETVCFMLDGTDYELELGEVHRRQLRQVLAPYIEHARRLKAAANGAKPKGTPATPRMRKPSNTEVRDWAKARGITVKERGRIAVEIVDQYHAWQQQAKAS